ncbi:hypothetical protein [Siphonobacter aquaeclarae]|uniref:Uncharacterized protein n=1 Tax=Siphonobacter aquaeclarae TaxID=563176 RepID=A0A1G9T8G3_9BACT|nr:hypothetical protein [Siphonobacter aquaeclarae]SDM44003.1 hypothetical protein SAMN04488090_3458 [Siphonobacter aquaeclarae]
MRLDDLKFNRHESIPGAWKAYATFPDGVSVSVMKGPHPAVKCGPTTFEVCILRHRQPTPVQIDGESIGPTVADCSPYLLSQILSVLTPQ